MKSSEFELIQSLIREIPPALREPAGLQDDTAILGRVLLTTDAMVEGVDFSRRTARPEEIGRKALAINLSDIAAMGGKPLYFTVALGLPAGIRPAWLRRVYRGMMLWAKRYQVICAGGDISKASQFFINVTVMGRTAGNKAVLRSGARPGNWIGVTGRLGGSLGGRHLTFKPRVEEGAWLARRGVTSMIDISDGFLQDLEHILERSAAGCALETGAIPVSTAARRRARGNTGRALAGALSDGEDFELIFTVPAVKKIALEKAWRRAFPGVLLSWVGRITPEKQKVRWLFQGRPAVPPRLARKGYQHAL